MSRHHRLADAAARTHEGEPHDRRVGLDEIDVLACVYGPGTSPPDLLRMQAYGAGWARALRAWQESGAPYCLVVAARAPQGGSGDRSAAPLAHPVVVLAHDPERLRAAIWSAMRDADTALCILESFEPSLDDYVVMLKAAALHAPGHA